ncbi:MAG: hypothetical protein GX020_04550 [Firmicutes bacterium]|nr:hypothetical protein [Bacillota bacterium]
MHRFDERVPIKTGDIVVRRSHNCDTYFVVRKIRGEIVELSGYHKRLCADAPISDLIIVSADKIKKLKKKLKS